MEQLQNKKDSCKNIALKFFNWFTKTETQPEVDISLVAIDTKDEKDISEKLYDYWLVYYYLPETIENYI